ncbi:hypothetical protein NX722_07960 [Endozoicomonas gorgoniicola]|uniref:DUF4760 domain-containing protein n=1 Tax=Endozoicomonas gorgoniicola TaxID=1234144 RepID=A0ABT3MUD0_9GAMM|nr:hypothetical protein [Endozoicomonas gorgoniicola]MCW7552584.1 hypothetical protein [Endozoicomonas gorgoniicola]
MQDIFTTFGIISACLVTGTAFVYAVSVLLSLVQHNYYRSLRGQIADAISDISKYYEAGEGMSEQAVRSLLAKLHSRYLVDIDRIKREDDEHVTVPAVTLHQVMNDLAYADIKSDDAPSSASEHADRAVTYLARLIDVDVFSDEQVRNYVRETVNDFEQRYPYLVKLDKKASGAP